MAIVIYCPRCGTGLKINGNVNMANLQEKNLTCPRCKNNSPFSSYKVQSQQNQNEPNTTTTPIYGNQSPNDPPSVTPSAKVLTPGRLVIPALKLRFDLKIGKNIIGRQAQSSTANFQIPCQEKLMSRNHILIEVIKNEAKGYVHKLSLNKEHSNPTFFGETPMEYGDKFYLHDGDMIQLPYTNTSRLKVHFLIPDPEETDTI